MERALKFAALAATMGVLAIMWVPMLIMALMALSTFYGIPNELPPFGKIAQYVIYAFFIVTYIIAVVRAVRFIGR